MVGRGKTSISGEIGQFKDVATGRNMTQWTNSKCKDQHLYFTSPTVCSDGSKMVILSERDGTPNLFVIDRNERWIRGLTNSAGLLRSYTYPSGGLSGLSKASPFLDDNSQRVFWIEDDAVWAVGLSDSDQREKICELPSGWVTGYTHLSTDGQKFCVACADPTAFDSIDKTQHHQLKNVPWRMVKNDLKTKLFVIDTATGKRELRAELPFWCTHVQFHPQSSDRILCNSEGTLSSRGFRDFPHWGRMWLVDGKGNYERVFKNDRAKFVNHENWSLNGKSIVYHGRHPLGPLKKNWARGLILLNRAGLVFKTAIENLSQHFIEACDEYGAVVSHCSLKIPVSHAVATYLADTILADSRNGCIYPLKIDGTNILLGEALCRHGSTLSDQDSHPHPVLTTAKAGIIYSSDVSGSCNVYEVDYREE